MTDQLIWTLGGAYLLLPRPWDAIVIGGTTGALFYFRALAGTGGAL